MVKNKIFQKRERKLTHGSARSDARSTKTYRVTIMTQQVSKKCRRRNKKDVTVVNIFSECSRLARTELKKFRLRLPQWLPGKYVFVPVKH